MYNEDYTNFLRYFRKWKHLILLFRGNLKIQEKRIIVSSIFSRVISSSLRWWNKELVPDCMPYWHAAHAQPRTATTWTYTYPKESVLTIGKWWLRLLLLQCKTLQISLLKDNANLFKICMSMYCAVLLLFYITYFFKVKYI